MQIIVTGKGTMKYIYDAAGNKLQKAVVEGTDTSITLYMAGSIYQNDSLQFFSTSEGRARPMGGTRFVYDYFLKDHLGNTRMVITDDYNVASPILEATSYYPFGLQQKGIGLRASLLNRHNKYLYNGKELQEDLGLDAYDYGARFYDMQIGRFSTVDPLADKFPGQSPYVAMDDNPILKNDPTGAAAAPIYDQKGSFLGTDNQGLQGKAIVMDQSNFQQGMSHDEALNDNLGVAGLKDDKAASNLLSSYNSLPSRPDYDGFVAPTEGIAWAKSHPGAEQNPTPENMLYLDASKLDFGNITTTDFKNGVGKPSPINLNTFGNFLAASINTTLRATVYALGRVDMTLLDNNGGIKIVNNPATDYDWNKGGGIIRNTLINYERWRAGVNDTHGFKTFYYGTGHLNLPVQLPKPGTSEFEMVR